MFQDDETEIQFLMTETSLNENFLVDYTKYIGITSIFQKIIEFLGDLDQTNIRTPDFLTNSPDNWLFAHLINIYTAIYPKKIKDIIVFLLRQPEIIELFDKYQVNVNSLLRMHILLSFPEMSYKTPDNNKCLLNFYGIYFTRDLTFVPDELYHSYSKHDFVMNNYGLIREFAEFGFAENSVGYFIKYDHKVNLMTIIQDSKFDINMGLYCLEIENFCECTALDFNRRTYSLISIAAFYGSENCFRLLKESGADIDNDCITLAIIGGNHDIMKFVETLPLTNVDMYVLPAIMSFRNEFLVWVVNNIQNIYLNLADCINSFNIPCMYYCIENSHDLDEMNNVGWTPLISAIYCENERMFDVLMLKGVNVNLKNFEEQTPLHIACIRGNIDMVRTLLDAGAFINVKDRNDMTPLNCASKFGRAEVCELLLSYDANKYIQNIDGFSPVHTASQHGHIDVLKVFAEDSDYLLTCDSKNNLSCLYYAASNGHQDCALFLIAKGAPLDEIYPGNRCLLHVAILNDMPFLKNQLIQEGYGINNIDLSGFSSLHYAAERNDEESCRLLVANGANIDSTEYEYDNTPLMIALKSGREELAEYFIHENCDVSIPDISGWYPLHFAAKFGFNSIVETIVKITEDVNVRSYENVTPLHMAVQSGNLDTVELLLKHNADPDARTLDDWSALHIAVHENHEGIVVALLKAGADINIVDKENQIPLHIATRKGFFGLAECLISKGSLLNAKNKHGRAPLHAACQNGHLEMCYLLVDKGANVNIKDNDGWTPLHPAAQNGHTKVCELLINTGTSINAKSNNEWTAIHLASQSGKLETCETLLIKGANPNCRDSNGWTPLHSAARNNHYNIIKLLLKHGALINAMENKYGQTALHVASKYGCVEACKLLLISGADPDIKKKDGKTPLMVARADDVRSSFVFYRESFD